MAGLLVGMHPGYTGCASYGETIVCDQGFFLIALCEFEARERPATSPKIDFARRRWERFVVAGHRTPAYEQKGKKSSKQKRL